MHNEELHSLYHSPNIVRGIKSRRLRWAGHVARLEGGRSAFKIFTGTPRRRRPLGRPRHRSENNIRMDPKEIVIIERIMLIQYKVRIIVHAALNLWVP